MPDFSGKNFDDLEFHFQSEEGDGSIGSPALPRSALRFGRNGSYVTTAFDNSTPANNRGLPVLMLSGDGAAPIAMGAGVAGASTPRSVLAEVYPTVYRNTALSSTDIQVVGSAASLYGWNFINPNTGAVYVKLYNDIASNVTVGTTTPEVTLMVPPVGSVVFMSDNVFHRFTTAMTIAVVTGLADNSTTAPATAIHAALRYR